MKKKTALILLLLILIGSYNVYAGTADYRLAVQPFNIDRELPTQTKTTNSDYFTHKLKTMAASYDAVYAWMETPFGTNLSNPETIFYEGGSTKTVNFYKSKDLSKGDKVVLNLENAYTTSVSVMVSGTYDYR